MLWGLCRLKCFVYFLRYFLVLFKLGLRIKYVNVLIICIVVDGEFFLGYDFE